MVVRARAAGRLASSNGQPSESDVVHNHIRLRQHQIVAITDIGISVGARHMKHVGTTESGKTVGSSPGSRQLSTRGLSSEMISDRRSDADRKMLVKSVGEYLLPSA
jgi:hypothetical protein